MIGDIAKIVSNSVDNIALNAGKKVIASGTKAGIARKSVSTMGHATTAAVKYGIYGAAGAGIIGGINGVIQPDKTLVGGSINGAGLGAVGGAGIGAIATAIAKGIR